MQRFGSRTIHRLAFKIRDGQRAATKYQEDSDGDSGRRAHPRGGGSGLGTAIVVLVGAALAVRLAGPVMAAVSELVYVLMIVVAVTAGIGAVGLVGLLAWRWRRTRLTAARARLPGAVPPLPGVTRAAQPLPEPRRRVLAPPDDTREIHLHLHGVSAEDVAAILERREDRR